MTAVFAHRGDRENCVENTLEAFVEARRLGAHGVEFDVRRSADGALVVHHDAVVPGVGPIAETACKDLPSWIPLLASAIGACEDMELDVEVKNRPGDLGYDPTGSLARAVAAELAELGRTEGVVVSCFDAPTLEVVRAAEPSLALGWLLGSQADLPGALAVAMDRGYQALNPHFAQVTAPFVQQCHEAGLTVWVWTPNSDSELEGAFDLGVDTLITDRLAAALAIAAHREGRGDGLRVGEPTAG